MYSFFGYFYQAFWLFPMNLLDKVIRNTRHWAVTLVYSHPSLSAIQVRSFHVFARFSMFTSKRRRSNECRRSYPVEPCPRSRWQIRRRDTAPRYSQKQHCGKSRCLRHSWRPLYLGGRQVGRMRIRKGDASFISHRIHILVSIQLLSVVLLKHSPNTPDPSRPYYYLSLTFIPFSVWI